ncbi:MAG: WD40 repeat domain-containing protein [Gemmataceae bacterium]
MAGKQPPASNVYWDLQTNTRHELPAGYGSATFTPDGSHYVFAAFQTQPAVSSRVVVYDTATDKPLRTLVEEPGRMIAGAIVSPDGKLVVAGSRDAKREKPEVVRIWELETGAEVGRIEFSGKTMAYSTMFSPDGRQLVVQDSEGGWFLWDAATRKTLAEHPADKSRMMLLKMFRSDGRVLIASSVPRSEQSRELDPDPTDLPQPRLQLLDVKTGKELAGFVMPNGIVAAVALSPDGRWLAAGGYGAVHLIDLAAKR